MNPQSKAILYGSLVVLFWSTVATAFKIALSEMGYMQLLLLSSLTALGIFIVNSLLTGKFRLLLNSLSDKKVVGRAMLLGALNPFLYYLVLFKAYSLLPAQVAQPLNYSWQLLLVLLSVIFLGRKVSRNQLIGLIVSFLGIVIISMQGDLSGFKVDSPFGVMLALSSAFIWATYWILDVKNKNGDSDIALTLNFFFGAIYLLMVLLFTGDFVMPSVQGALSAVYVGFFEMGVTFILWGKALRLTANTARLTGLTYLSPFLSLLIIHFTLGENIYLTTVVGLVFIVSGIVFGNVKIGKTNEKT